MKAREECYSCLEGLLRQAAELAAEQSELKDQVIEQGLQLLDKEFSTDKTTIVVATKLHRLVRELTGNRDPYRQIKEAEVAMAVELRRSVGDDTKWNLRDYLVYAARGNNIDFFMAIDDIIKEIAKPVEFSIDDTPELERKLTETKSILYLADNAGEVPFDVPLVRLFGKYAPVTYVVKESPVQDDITIADVEKFGMTGELPGILSTGTDTPGVVMDMASPEFKTSFEDADLVLAKGMGYWETLEELPARGKVFHLLKTKCKPVADSLGVNLN
ncbi:MAG: ARMT1-like domain-containing protein, partial [Chloroflexota bacterium]|nr:ARMT1-like domain-containing protein [Chloroflexota bacterium]